MERAELDMAEWLSRAHLPPWPLPALPLASQGLSSHWYSQLFTSSSCPFRFGFSNVFGRNDAEAEAPVLWPPHVKS